MKLWQFLKYNFWQVQDLQKKQNILRAILLYIKKLLPVIIFSLILVCDFYIENFTEAIDSNEPDQGMNFGPLIGLFLLIPVVLFIIVPWQIRIFKKLIYVKFSPGLLYDKLMVVKKTFSNTTFVCFIISLLAVLGWIPKLHLSVFIVFAYAFTIIIPVLFIFSIIMLIITPILITFKPNEN